MKKVMLLAAFLVACGPAEQPAVDTPATAGPAPISAADLAGTWTGTMMAEGSDSVLGRFTVVNPTGNDAKIVTEGSRDSVAMSHTFDADSFVATSAVYTDQNLPGKPQVTTRAVGRLVMPGQARGTSTIMLASKPDSVLLRTRWEATKSP